MSSVTDVAATVVGALGVPAVFGALFYAAQQAKLHRAQVELQTQQEARTATTSRAALDLQLIRMAVSLDQLFIDSPDLRPFIYDAQVQRWRVLAIAELIVDLADAVGSMVRHDQLHPDDERAWAEAIGWYGRSPAVRYIAEQYADIYRPPTVGWLLADPVAAKHPLTADAKQAPEVKSGERDDGDLGHPTAGGEPPTPDRGITS
jgi:hypothetical protein